jgi:hypothetical protein
MEQWSQIHVPVLSCLQSLMIVYETQEVCVLQWLQLSLIVYLSSSLL